MPNMRNILQDDPMIKNRTNHLANNAKLRGASQCDNIPPSILIEWMKHHHQELHRKNKTGYQNNSSILCRLWVHSDRTCAGRSLKCNYQFRTELKNGATITQYIKRSMKQKITGEALLSMQKKILTISEIFDMKSLLILKKCINFLSNAHGVPRFWSFSESWNARLKHNNALNQE